jgi:MoxR-like ATPase
MNMSDPDTPRAVRLPAERLHARELHALAANDDRPKPEGWQLSPQAVRTFIVGSRDQELRHAWEGGEVKTSIRRKFYGDDALVERCIVTLMGSRGLLLVGEPGTAKSMLSELLAAAICGDSTLTIQGTAGTTEDQIRYSWNYARLLAEGPSEAALAPAPLYLGLKQGRIVRLEEITRCLPEIQDTLISILSDKVLHIPELSGQASVLLACRGFNVVATANTRDRGVHEMSSALKRRFNFETVPPIADLDMELELVVAQARALLAESQADVKVDPDVVKLLVTTFQELRNGKTAEGAPVDRPSTVMSTAEAVAVAHSAGLDARYFSDGALAPEHLVRQLRGTALKDDPQDARKLRHYFDTIVKPRASRDRQWKAWYAARRLLGD